jgi:hypothetical protein
MNEKTADGIEIFSFSTDRIEFKSEDDNDYIIGYVSTHERDIVDDIITKNCMMDMLAQFKDGRSKLDLEHETLRGDTKLEKKMNITKVPLAVSVDALYDGKGLMVKYKMNREYKKLDSKGDVVYDYPAVKAMVKSGALDAFSIAYITEKAIPKETDGVMSRLLDKIQWINTALTGNPINRGAKMVDVMMKSLDNAETKPFGEYSSFEDCVNKNKDKSDPEAYYAVIKRKIEGKGDLMGEDKKPDNPDVSASLKSVEARLAALEVKNAEIEKKSETGKAEKEVERKAAEAVSEELKRLDKKIDGVKELAEKPVFSAKAGDSNLAELAKKKALEETDPLSFV